MKKYYNNIFTMYVGIYSLFSLVVVIVPKISAKLLNYITQSNYTNILKAANENVDDYVGCKIHFTGYVYRLLDFEDNQFVLARDMVISNNEDQALVVGFLSTYENAKDFEDGTWVDVVGEIIKGDFNGDIAIVKVTSMNKVDKPEDAFVTPPDDTYIPTSAMF